MKSTTIASLIFVIAAAAALSAETSGSPQAQKNFAQCFKNRVHSDEEIKKVHRIIAAPPCFEQPFVKTLKEYLMISYFPGQYRNPLRECYYCQKMITGSVHMYNLEHKPEIRWINDEMLSLKETPLIPEYLKHPFPKPEKECHYESVGDATDPSGLFIYCVYHGSCQNPENFDSLKVTVGTD